MRMLQSCYRASLRFQLRQWHAMQLHEKACWNFGHIEQYDLKKTRPKWLFSPRRNFTSRSMPLYTASRSYNEERDNSDKEGPTSDFFGIEEYEQGGKNEAPFGGCLKKDVPFTGKAKLPFTSEAKQKKSARTQISKEEENILSTHFGLVRLDGRRSDIKKKSDLDSKTISSSLENSSGSDFIDEQYFQFDKNQTRTASSQSFISSEDKMKVSDQTMKRTSSSEGANSSSNVFDEQYFGSSVKQNDKDNTDHNIHEQTKSGSELQADSNLLNFDSPQAEQLSVKDMNVFDQQMFGVHEKAELDNDQQSSPYSVIDSENTVGDSPAVYSVTDDMINPVDENSLESEEQLKPTRKYAEKMEYEFHEPLTKRGERWKSTPKPNIEEPKTAYDVAMKIRLDLKGSEEKTVGDVDSKGFRILKNQVPDFSRTPEFVMVSLLRDSIIYNDNDIVAIDKPYGLPSQGGQGVNHSIASLLPKLAKKINIETLHSIHRLDKDTTGVMVFAKTREMQLKLTRMFKDREIIKKYWVITKGVPNPPGGVIEIPIAESTVAGAYRMTLKPEYDEKTKLVMKKSRMDTQDAVTKYQILDSCHDAALVLCEPKTGAKHQIRCHLAFGLNVPILGDHKYSHFTKLAPQRLFPAMLQKLGIRQSKVRHVPMHLHAKSIIIPNVLDGRYLHLSTKLPRHFVTNMQRLKLKPPK